MYSSTGMTKSTSKRGFELPNSQLTNYESVSKKTLQTIGIDGREIEHSSFYLQHKARNTSSQKKINRQPSDDQLTSKHILNGFKRWNQQNTIASIKRIYRPKKTKREISHDKIVFQSQPQMSDFKKSIA